MEFAYGNRESVKLLDKINVNNKDKVMSKLYCEICGASLVKGYQYNEHHHCECELSEWLREIHQIEESDNEFVGHLQFYMKQAEQEYLRRYDG